MIYSLEEHNSQRKVLNKITESLGVIDRDTIESKFVLAESEGQPKREKLIVELEAIHVGKTKNHTYYTQEGLTAGIQSWTQPYNKPVLTHHDSRRGEPIGRILSARFEKNTKSGRPGLIFETEITDKDAIEKVKDGRYSTVSIGGHTDKVTCNCCGTDRTQEWCEHYPGETYDGIQCHFIIGETYGEEVSYVNVPADENAGNVVVTSVTESAGADPILPKVEPTPEGATSVTESTGGGVDDTKLPTDPETGEEGQTSEGKDPEQTQTSEPEGTEPKDPIPAVQEGAEGDEGQTDPEEPKGIVLTEGQIVVEQADYDALKSKIEALEHAAVTSKVNFELMQDENAALREKVKGMDDVMKESLVNEIFALKEGLQKPDATNKEATLASLRERQINSLEDLKADLLSESKAMSEGRPEKVDNPAAKGLVEEGKASDDQKPMTMQEGLGRILKNFGKK